jgi:hypothetical protein
VESVEHGEDGAAGIPEDVLDAALEQHLMNELGA